MSKAEAVLVGLRRLFKEDADYLQPGWFDVIEVALADAGYYIAPIIPVQTIQSRSTDPRTSHAAEPTPLRAGTQRHLLLSAYHSNVGREWENNYGGLTDEEAATFAEGVSPTSEYAKRCSELRAAGLIIDTGKNRKGNSGLDRIVCRITEAGKAELRRLGS